MTRTYQIGRFGFGFCTERGKVVRENGYYTFWLLWKKRGSKDVHIRTSFPWGRAPKKHNEQLIDSPQYRAFCDGEAERLEEDRLKTLADEAGL